MDPRNGNLLALMAYTDAEARRRRPVEVRRELSRAERRSMKIGRNSPCGCGSGKKFKRCCLTSAPEVKS